MALLEELKKAWDYVSWIEPALGKVTRNELDRVEQSIEAVAELTDELDELDDEDNASACSLLAVLYTRGAAIAIAAGDEALANRWFDEGEHYADDVYAPQLANGRSAPERFRRLVHGRQLMSSDREKEARALWRGLVDEKADDAIAEAARAEQAAPRPLKDGQMPTLGSFYGIGLGFSGSRDRWDDGSYVTTHCFKVLFIPLWAIRAYRVVDGGDETFYVLAREQLSKFAKLSRYALLAAIVLLIVGIQVNSHLSDPTRLAKQRWDETLEKVASAKPDDALRQLDARLADDIWRVGSERAQKAGAEIVRITAAGVPKPFTVAALDQAGRVVRRYEALPKEARGGAARDLLLASLEKWTAELGESLDTAEARLELLRHAERNSDAKRQGPLLAKIESTRLAAADAKIETAPLEALAMFVERPSTDAIARANKIVEKLNPAMLVDASAEIAKWKPATTDAALRRHVEEQLDAAIAARADAQAQNVTAKQLDALVKKHPWNQWAHLALANLDVEAGKLEAAYARLAALGKSNELVRDVRQTLAQLASAVGKLEEADVLLTSLLGARLARFQTVAAEYDAAAKKLEEQLIARLKIGDVPYELPTQLGRANEAQQRELLIKWMREQMDADASIKAKRDAYLALGDVVPAALAAGGVKLRRAQAMSGATRDAMLGEAERMFLAIRTEAEGQPEFRIGLGEIYARLGKTKESEEQFQAVLAMDQPDLSMRVARVYRSIGSTERAKQVAKDVFAKGQSPSKDNAAVLLGIMHDGVGDETEAEAWFRKADQSDSMVKTSLLELEARKLMHAGKLGECAAKYAQVAKLHLQNATAMDVAAYNNAALAHQNRFQCSGDLQALADAEATLEKAYRTRGDEPILVGNLGTLHDDNGRRRVLGKRVDLRALQLTSGEVDTIVGMLLDGSEHAAVLADLDADRGIRRSTELFTQYAVLAPNSVQAYRRLGTIAWEHRDVAAYAALVQSARNAKGLDGSDLAYHRERFIKGELDAQITAGAEATIAKLDAVLAKPKLDSRTRAAALVTKGTLHSRVGVYLNKPAEVVAAREAYEKAAALWPAIAEPMGPIGFLIDEAGLAADAQKWIELRRVWTATAALAKQSAEGTALAKAILASPQWSRVRALAQSDTTPPTIDHLRLARLLGDATLEARAKAVLDDKLWRHATELALVLDPTSPSAAADLAYLDKR